jgi:hypothetical protein
VGKGVGDEGREEGGRAVAQVKGGRGSPVGGVRVGEVKAAPPIDLKIHEPGEEPPPLEGADPA